jgi:hypothetical protein
MENLVCSLGRLGLRLCLVEAALAIASFAAPSITIVEPPDWFARHIRNSIVVMPSGPEKGASAAGLKDRRIDFRQTSDNGQTVHNPQIYLGSSPKQYPLTIINRSAADQPPGIDVAVAQRKLAAPGSQAVGIHRAQTSHGLSQRFVFR